MKCSDYTIWVALKLEGALAPDQERELGSHLSVCSRCRAELLFQKKIAECLAEIPPSGLSSDFTERVLSRALAQVRLQKRLRIVRRLVPALVYAVGVVFLLIFRAEIARLVPAASADLADAINGGVARLGSAVTGLFPASVDIPADRIPLLAAMSQLLTNNLVVAGLACGIVLWAFSRVLAFMHD